MGPRILPISDAICRVPAKPELARSAFVARERGRSHLSEGALSAKLPQVPVEGLGGDPQLNTKLRGTGGAFSTNNIQYFHLGSRLHV